MKQIKKLICNIRPDRLYLAVPLIPEVDDRFFVYEVQERDEDGYGNYIRHNLGEDLIIEGCDYTNHDCLWDWIDDIADSLSYSDGVRQWDIYEFRTKKGLQRHLNKYKILKELVE